MHYEGWLEHALHSVSKHLLARETFRFFFTWHLSLGRGRDTIG